MKNIVLRDEIYGCLSEMKIGKESFSDVIQRLISAEPNLNRIRKYAGILKTSGLSDLVETSRKSLRVREFDL